MSFGGSVKLTGENEYKKALKDISSSLKLVSAEMKATASGFEAGEKSEKEVAASAKELHKALDEQKKALSDLKNLMPELNAKYEAAGKKHKELSSELAIEKKTLQEVEKEFGKSSKEYKDQEKVVNDLEKEVKKSGAEYERLGKDVTQCKTQIANAETTINQTTMALDKMSEEEAEAGEEAEKSTEGFTVMKGALANLASQAISAVVDGLKQIGQAFVDVGKEALASYAEFEQLEGGVKKLFGDDVAETVAQNAQRAFQTAGMSANEYMETVTNFSASLISGLGGDTEKAAAVADQAVRDMSDNANTFGTSIESIQNAYQGFAKGNFQMLDNLKLGYGGTSAEMLRLVQDAGVVDKSVKSINDVSFDQMIEAIHIVQENMNITGTTAKEASMTIEGATGSMKAAWQNLLTGMADENADFGSLVSDFIGTLVTPDGKGGVIGTMVPRITQVITGISEAISTAVPELINAIIPIIGENLPVILEAVGSAVKTLVTTLGDVLRTYGPELVNSGIDMLMQLADGIIEGIPDLEDSLPKVIDSAVSALTSGFGKILSTGTDLLKKLVEGIKKAIPVLVKMLPTVIKSTINTLMSLLPQIVSTGKDLLEALVDGLISAIPELVKALPVIIDTIVDVLVDNLPLIVTAGVELLTALIDGIIKAIPELVKAVPEIIKSIIDTLKADLPKIIDAGKKIVTDLVKGIGDNLGKVGEKALELGKTLLDKIGEGIKNIADVGKDLVEGVWKGISDHVSWIVDKIKGFGKSVTDAVKKAFGIQSPSKVMRDSVGKYLAQGIGIGFTDEMQAVARNMQDAIPTDFSISGTGTRTSQNMWAYDTMVNAFKDALAEMKVEMDGYEMGRFVDKTVTKLAYA